MTLDAGGLGSFGDLAKAIGLLDADGSPNTSWFGDPVGSADPDSSGNQHGLRHLLADDDQRAALLAFVDGVLGPPDRAVRAGQTWVPLFTNSDPHVTVAAVVAEVAGAVQLGVGFEHTIAGGVPRVSTRVHVPLFQFERHGGTPPTGPAGMPSWLLVGTPGARVRIEVDATFAEVPPAPGAASLGGVTLGLGIPTTADDSLAVEFTLRDLQLPGAPSPRTFSFDATSLDDLGTDVLDLVLGLVRAQADTLSGVDPALAPFRAVAGLLGLRDVAGVPPLPLADLPTRGISALVDWVESVLVDPTDPTDHTARDAWLGELASLVGGTVVAGGSGHPDGGVQVVAGPVAVTVGVRVTRGVADHPVLVPWLELALDTRTGARARLAADLLRADTGTDVCTALPDLRVEAVFGEDAGGSPLLPGAAPHVGSLHTGVALDPTGRPAFVLTLQDVVVAGGGPTYDVLDLSSPSAALDSAASVLEGALADAIANLGPAGVLVNRLLGLDPPPGIDPLDVPALFTDPLAAVRTYWRDVTGGSAAATDVLGRLRALVTGVPVADVPGAGTTADPWRVELLGGPGPAGVDLTVWREDTRLLAALSGRVGVPVLGSYEVTAGLGANLVRVDLSGAGGAAFGVDAYGSLTLRRPDATPVRLPLGAYALEADDLSVRVGWAAGRGLRAALSADRLALVTGAPDGRIPIDLPTLDANGNLAFPAADWLAVERAAGALLGELRMPAVDALLDIVGWTGTGAHLSLAGLVGADPEADAATTVRAWLADLVLDCDRVRAALGPVAALLSGFGQSVPGGTGSARDPYRCPVSGEVRAPGLAVWLDPGCVTGVDDLIQRMGSVAGGESPDAAALDGLLRGAARAVPDLADLLVGRNSLAQGLDLLVTRWAGTDGLVGRPTALPDDVTAVELGGLTYAELVALGSVGMLLPDVLDPPPAAVVYVGCEPTWVRDRPAGTAFDRSVTAATGAAAAGGDTVGAVGTVPATGGGTWFVRLPTPTAAAAERPDRGGVGEQAVRLAAVLAGRTDPIVVVGYGGCGAAVVRTAATVPAVSDVVTVGTPWAGLAVDSLHGGLGGDALRLLRRLERPGREPWPDLLLAQEATPREQAAALVGRSVDAAGSDTAIADLASAGDEARRSGLAVHAVFGDLDEETLARGLTAYVMDGVQARIDTALAAYDRTDGEVTALHAGVSLPVTDLDLGGLLVGVGATVELCRVSRATDAGLRVEPVRGVVVDIHLGVTDGWLAGGPGSDSTVGEVRWMSARIDVPLDGRPGDAELVLHEARGFDVERERWVVRADPTGAAPDVTVAEVTSALPEVRVLLADVVARLRAASPDLAALLDLLGVTRDGGLDPGGLDRLLHDTAHTVREQVAANPADVAARLRALVPAATGAGAVVGWSVGPATLGTDLATGAFTASLRAATAGLPEFAVDVTLGATGMSATASLGALDPAAGGLRLVAGTTPAGVAVEWAAPGPAGRPGVPVRRVALLPRPDEAALRDLATVVVPAVAAHGALGALRQVVPSTAPLLDAVLDAVGLLTPADDVGFRSVVVPVGLVQDPGGWLRHGVATWRANAAAGAAGLLDALAPLLVPDRGTATGWPLGDGVVVDYAVESGDRLRLRLDVSLAVDAGGGTTATTHLSAGLLVGPDGLPHPTIGASVDVDGRGLALDVALGTDPPVRLRLLRPPAAPLPLYPQGPGLGDALATAGETVLPVVLNALAGHRTDSGTPVLKTVGQAVFDLGEALDLRDGDAFTATRLTSFAANPAARLAARLPFLVSTGAAALATALDPAGTVVGVTAGTGTLTLGFGGTGPGPGRPVELVLDASGASGALPAVEVRADVTVAGLGRFALERLRLSAAGVDVAARLGPLALDLGAFTLRPLVVVRAGSASGASRTVGLGLALDDGAARSVEFRWGLDATPPSLAAVLRTSPGGAESIGTAVDAAEWLLAVVLSVAGGVVVDGLRSVLGPKAVATLQGVVFTDGAGSTDVDPDLALDLLDPEALLGRLERLLWNAAQEPALSVTLDGKVRIGLASTGTTTRQLGLTLALEPGQRFTLAESDTRVDLEVDASWVSPEVAAGLAVYVLSGTSPADLAIDPAVSVSGLGLRFTNTSGPLLSLGSLSLDGIAVHVYGEARTTGLGGGVNLELAGLAFAPGGGGGSNAVANSIMNDAGQSGPSARPAFSPSFAVQKHPGSDAAVSLRAGPVPGPWWIVVQRQLGPLYLERVGFDTVESGGTLSRISLYFDGLVSIFGLTAAVDRLSISWTGGDPLDLHSWAVDLMGLAISADLSGASLSGGLLKTVGPPDPGGPVSYVGMLLGRFGTYGLSVFGGYTDDHGNPSFFVFGGVNGPIGGPPAFFVTGIGGGLGVNRGLHIPDDPSGFNDFPFIAALDPAARPPEDPMAELRRLNDYFPPQRGLFWFAAGLSFTCFTLVDGIAVLAVSFSDGLEVSLLGLARMALPRPEAALVSIELGLLARFSTKEGSFVIRAALTENSWLLYPEVRLSGGFAFATWWKGPLAGQFVMSLGGYHPDFHRDGYPEVPRLGLTWRVSDAITIKGGAYFALTSEALMAGVDVEVSADFGWAWARIAFGAHGIVYFDPFWFEVQAYARISAGVKIDTFFGTISISISVGARIRVWGPDFSGEATLEVGPCDIGVGFGSERRVEPRVLGWAEFVAKYLEDAGGGTARVLSAITGRGTLPAATGGDRSAPTSDGTAGRPFEVYAEFELTVVTTVPTARIDIGLAGGPVPVPVIRSDNLPAVLGLKPMRAGGLVSTLRIRLEQRDSTTGVWTDLPEPLRQLGANLAAVGPRPEGSTVGREAFPIGTWGEPDPAGLPAPALPTGDVVRAGNQVRLVAEAATMARGPEIDYYRVEAARRPLPLQAGGPSRADLLATAGTVEIPHPVTVSQALVAAGEQLFAVPPRDLPAGLLPSGARSALARAAYGREVSAPPLFGTLADGMAPVNAADAAAARTPAGPAPTPRPSRPPVVAGFLTAGSGVAARPPATTVADRRIKRRVAPTLDSVRARLGAHLPVAMHLAALPAVERAGTLAALRVPRTEATGATRSYPLGTSGLTGLVGGITGAFGPAGPVVVFGEPHAGPDGAQGSPDQAQGVLEGRQGGLDGVPVGVDDPPAPADGRDLAAGELVVLMLPDAAVDVADADRPVLEVAGRARVTVLPGDGSVALDDVVTDAPAASGGIRVAVPPAAALVAVQADGAIAQDGRDDGVAGWHARSRVCSLGSQAALADGCVLTVAGGPTVRGAAWVTAADLLSEAAEVRTSFARPVSAVAIVVEDGDADRLDAVSLELQGARRATTPDGADVPPTVLLSGDQAVLAYAVVPIDPKSSAPVVVRTRAGGDWRVTGVLGARDGVDFLARQIVRSGVVAATGRVLAGTGQGARLRWIGVTPSDTPSGAPSGAGARPGAHSHARSDTHREGGRRDGGR